MEARSAFSYGATSAGDTARRTQAPSTSPAIGTEDRLGAILIHIGHLNWEWVYGALGDGFFLQASFVADGEPQRGRKWYVSKHATESEVVQTALMAVLAAAEHEVREKFLVRGLPIFNPHIASAALASVCGAREVRREPEGQDQSGR